MIHVARARRLARDVQPAIVRIQWRRRGSPADVVTRHAVVIDPEGWLLMAGPRPSPDGTLAAVFEDGRAMRAEVWASDPLSCLSVLRVPVTRLPPLSLREPASTPPASLPPPGETAHEDREDRGGKDEIREHPMAELPVRLPPGFPFLMVTAVDPGRPVPVVARGIIRANHRRRDIDDPILGRRLEVTCLDEAALGVLSTDLGAPWVDRDGRIVGLLVGADLNTPQPAGSDILIRPEVTGAYAVPAEVIRIVWPLLKVRREVPRAALGVYVRHLSDATRTHICPECGGYEVIDLAPGGPADRSQILVGDVICTVDGRPMAPAADLSDVLLSHRPGDRVRIGVVRQGKPLEIPVVVGRPPQ